MKPSRCFQAIIMVIVLLLSGTCVYAQGPISGFYYPADEMIDDWEYYADRSFYHDNNHLGTDIDLAEGVAIKAMAKGEIVYYAGASSYGELVIAIEHELPEDITFLDADRNLRTTRYVLSIYGHLRKSEERNGLELTWQIGDIVQQGEIVGYINNSSHPDNVHPDPNGDGLEHLHFAIRLSDKATAMQQDGNFWLRGYNNGSGMQIHFTDPILLISGLAQFAQSPSWRIGGSSQAFQNKYNSMSNNDHHLGDSWDNGGSAYVHDLDGMWIQDFKDHRDSGGASNGYDHAYTAIIYFDDPWMSREPHLLKEGFWYEYMSTINSTCVAGWEAYGVPVSDEYDVNGVFWQDFKRFGPNYANDHTDFQAFYFTWNTNTEVLEILDQSFQSVSLASCTIENSSARSSGNNNDSGPPQIMSSGGQEGQFGDGGNAVQRNLIFNSQHMSSRSNSRTDDPDGVYHSGIRIAELNQAFDLVDQQDYQDFYAVVNQAVIPIDDFSMDGDTTIYVGDPPPEADIQFSHWTIYPNPGTVGEQLHVEGEIYNAGGASVTASELRIELLDPNGTEVFHWSSYDVTLTPGYGWYLWIELYPYMEGNHTACYRGLVDGQWQTYAIETVYVQSLQPVASFSYNRSSGDVPLAVQFMDLSTNNPTSWLWDFGDGNTSTSQYPSHVYNTVGIYSISLTATNSAGSDVETCSNCITVNQVIFQPVADFSIDFTSGESPLNVQFTDLSTNDPNDWYWDFGDGNTSTSQHPSHEYYAYDDVYIYSVSLQASNSAGSDVVDCDSCITVTPAVLPPIADFIYDPSSGDAPLTVQFTDLSTNDPTSWWWDFGDGYTSSSQHPSHIYDSIGVHTVYLSVANDADSDTKTYHDCITVNQVVFPVHADFIANDTSGFVPLTVYFADQSTNEPDHWYWEFGDGDTSTVQHPSHAYDAIGDYSVCLVAGNSVGNDAMTRVDYIHVGSAAIELEIVYLDGNVVLDWNDVLGAEWYHVYYADDNDKYIVIEKTELSTCTLSIDLFDSASAWFFYVTAVQ